jgi:hypothetical protein
MSLLVTTRPVFIVRLRPKPRVDAIRALRAALKVLGRQFGLKAIEVREESRRKAKSELRSSDSAEQRR